ncbi:esterase-like activity of phytase family protein [Commensalibacter nepenthis]|uniref:Esterase-like activity of phytase family protein n=1 Tax=Commensalibacter nepenthis TaxID=3043872 RepID=A0ABT6QAH7_9PROT|nr:esterase-like activity of phytase family protein [Commensalibacter sp. TBRC 10068]MDI2113310.1 esterase-like activity of phytase family protein [Commensalibacter sp. TBRC 10068]
MKQDAPGYIRITKLNSDGQSVAQYAYGIDHPAMINVKHDGVAEILVINNNQLLILERGYISNQSNTTTGINSDARIYEINLQDAHNIFGGCKYRSNKYAIDSKKSCL